MRELHGTNARGVGGGLSKQSGLLRATYVAPEHPVSPPCRARPVVTVEAQLLLQPVIINLENKTCQIPESTASVAW